MTIGSVKMSAHIQSRDHRSLVTTLFGNEKKEGGELQMILNPGEGKPVETSDLWLVSPLVSKYWALIGGLSQYRAVIGQSQY